MRFHILAVIGGQHFELATEMETTAKTTARALSQAWRGVEFGVWHAHQMLGAYKNGHRTSDGLGFATTGPSVYDRVLDAASCCQ